MNKNDKIIKRELVGLYSMGTFINNENDASELTCLWSIMHDSNFFSIILNYFETGQ